MSVGSASSEVIYQSQGDDENYGRNKAITAGVVGGILFFITAIILAICAVKICNKRKRRKAEKAYMMVTCSLPDQRNGGHSHAGSPLPIKNPYFMKEWLPGPQGGWTFTFIPVLREST
ncbi:Protein turtle, partial [Stegodyphus mimosarum]